MSSRENEIISLVTFIHNRIGFREPPFSMLDFCAAFTGFELLPAELPAGFDGEIIMKGRQRIIRYRSGSKPASNRFAIGHEIGHGFLHEDQEFQCKVSNSFSIFKPPPGNPKEWEADYFSSELLAPLPALNRMTKNLPRLSPTEAGRELARMASLFGVPRAVMRSRFADLARLREWECEFL